MRAIRFSSAAVALAAAFCSGTTDAALVIELQQNVNALPNTTGNTFDVFVRGTGAPTAIDTFSLTLNVAPAAGNAGGNDVTFSGVASPPNYLFAADPAPVGPTATSLPGLTSITFIGGGVLPVTVNVGDLFGLGTVLFDVDAAAVLGDAFDVSIDYASSFFTDPATPGLLAFTPAPPLDGTTIAIADPAAVPEPSSLALLGLCGLVGGVLNRRRRRTVAQA